MHQPLRDRHERLDISGERPVTWPVVLLVAFAASVVAWLRMPEQVAGQLYAEDGPLFFGQVATEGFSTVLSPYAGYQHLLPRLLSAAIAVSVPVTYWATATNIAVCLTIGAVAALVTVCSREVTRSPVLRVLLGLLPALAPFAHVEALGNLANLHWFMLYAMVWLVLATPRSTVGAWLMASAALLATLTETQCILLLPVVLWRLRRDARLVWPVAAAWAIGSLVQLASYAAAPRVLAVDRPPLASVVDGYVINVVIASFSVRPRIVLWSFEHVGLWGGAGLLLLGIALIVSATVFAATSPRVAVLVLFYSSLASWAASFMLGAIPSLYYSEIPWAEWSLIRWGTAASMLFIAAVLVSLDVVGRQWRPLRVPAATARLAIAALLAVGAPFALGAGEDTWQSRVDAARSTCTTGAREVIVTSAPALHWQMRLPCPLLT